MRPDFSQAVTQMREILSGSDFPDENHRKAALRRALHSSSVGLTAEEIQGFVDQLRERFPDRSYENAMVARDLEGRNADLETQLTQLREENEELNERLRGLDSLVQGLFTTATQLQGGRVATGGAAVQTSRPTKKLEPFFKGLEEVLRFAAQQESISQSVEGLLSQKSGSGGRPVSELLSRLALGEGESAAELEQLRTRLLQLGLAPAAMMAGVQQSWTGGTTQVLEYLDPAKCEESIPTKLPGLRDVAVLKEVRNRFQQFWTRLDDNVAHYYRGTFERVYREKMEERR